MARLLRDRYYEFTPDRAWDLATGDHVDTARLGEPRPARDPALATFVELLDHGREGAPRWVVVHMERGRHAPAAVDAAAEHARARGFVPIAVELYMRLRAVLLPDLSDRALVLIATPGVTIEASRAAFLDACARSPRPHVLLTFGSPQPTPAPLATRNLPFVVHEARAVYGAAPLRTASATVLRDDVAQQVARGTRAMEFAYAGRHAAAERLLRDVAGALIRRRAFGPACDAYVRLGRLLLERGRARQAEDIFADAAGHADSARDEALAVGARLWQAAAKTDAGRLSAAEALARAVLLAGCADPLQRAAAEATLGRVLLWQGRADEAVTFAFAAPACPPGSAAFVHGTAVRVLIERGDLFAAGQRARQLIAATRDAADPLARVIAGAAHLRVLLAIGDFVLADECFSGIVAAARAARSPLRVARVRVLLAEALTRAGRDATGHVARLQHLLPVAPPLLREQIERLVRGGTLGVRPRRQASMPRGATEMVGIAHREENDRDALARLCEFVAGALHTSRVDLWSADAGPATIVLTAGTGLPTRLGERVLEAGIAIGPEPDDPGRELGVPIRLGTRLLAALVVRWPVDRTPPADAADVVALAAAVAAPRVESLLAVGREETRAATAIPELVGASAAMAEVRRAVVRAAAAPFAVMIEGESGVGKELVARAIHQLSPRRERRFCDVNCAALPEELLESELFGHARGAFTGAVVERAGMFEDADGGTLFLDEVIDLSPRAQAKLLRVVQQQEVRRVGETFSRKVDVRLVSAANRDLRAEAAAGRFRHDLLYRLQVICIRIPPLRERPEDIPLLAAHFWRVAAARLGTRATLAHATFAALARYHWPGNVRELQNAIAALAVEAPARGSVRPTVLPSVITGAAALPSGRLAEARARFERRFIEVALARAGGSRTRAARELGVSRQGLLKLMTRLGLNAT